MITRFAPSPTGFLHIGGARTALFNWLLARRFGGKMLLRIEDTDRARSTENAVNVILEDLTWLGVRWDDEPVFQHQRADRHREIAQKLLKEGLAYLCYSAPETLQTMREDARKEGRSLNVSRLWRDADRAPPSDVQPVVRLKSSLSGKTVIHDAVQGTVSWENEDLDDLVLLRSDGSPTYMLAVVVDDHDMEVTHIVRGDDHLTNAARQKQIYEALGWPTPKMAHIPLIHGSDGAKLSKRHGALGVDAYRKMGCLPEALCNYLVRLGWGYKDQEMFSMDEMVSLFTLENVKRSPARFDTVKLLNLNGQHIRASADDALCARLEDFLKNTSAYRDLSDRLDPATRAKIAQATPGLKERAESLADLAEGARFLFLTRPIPLDAKAAQLLDASARQRLADVADALAAEKNWEATALEEALRRNAKETNQKLGALAQPLRAALTGKTTSIGVFDVLACLGREESLARIAEQEKRSS